MILFHYFCIFHLDPIKKHIFVTQTCFQCIQKYQNVGYRQHLHERSIVRTVILNILRFHFFRTDLLKYSGKVLLIRWLANDSTFSFLQKRQKGNERQERFVTFLFPKSENSFKRWREANLTTREPQESKVDPCVTSSQHIRSILKLSTKVATYLLADDGVCKGSSIKTSQSWGGGQGFYDSSTKT